MDPRSPRQRGRHEPLHLSAANWPSTPAPTTRAVAIVVNVPSPLSCRRRRAITRRTRHADHVAHRRRELPDEARPRRGRVHRPRRRVDVRLEGLVVPAVLRRRRRRGGRRSIRSLPEQGERQINNLMMTWKDTLDIGFRITKR